MQLLSRSFRTLADRFHSTRSRAVVAAILAAAAILISCFLLLSPLDIRVSVPETLLEGRDIPPLPDGYRLVPGKNPTVRARRGLFAPGVIIADCLAVDSKPGTDRIVSREYLFPVRIGEDGVTGDRYDGLLGAVASEALESLRSQTGADVRLLKAGDIPEGTYALAAAGIAPEDPSYPFILTRTARCAFAREEYRTDLAPWLETLFPDTNDDSVVYVGAVGDMMLARGVEAALRSGAGIKAVFTDTLPVLQSCGLLIGNLEGTITGASAKAQKTYTFKFGKSVLPALHEAGFTYLMLTNNHSFDYGLAGFTDTLAAVRAAGFATSGAGMNEKEAEEPWRTEIGGQRFSVISCGAYPVENSGFNGKKTAAADESRAGILWESGRVNEIVRAEKESGAFVIVNVHGGQEYVRTPSAAQRRLYESLCDSGADAVFGSHPHVLQPVEARGRSLIVYSLGNFVFPGMQGMSGAEESLIIRLGVYRNRIVTREEIPAKLSGTSVGLKTGRAAK